MNYIFQKFYNKGIVIINLYLNWEKFLIALQINTFLIQQKN